MKLGFELKGIKIVKGETQVEIASINTTIEGNLVELITSVKDGVLDMVNAFKEVQANQAQVAPTVQEQEPLPAKKSVQEELEAELAISGEKATLVTAEEFGPLHDTDYELFRRIKALATDMPYGLRFKYISELMSVLTKYTFSMRGGDMN